MDPGLTRPSAVVKRLAGKSESMGVALAGRQVTRSGTSATVPTPNAMPRPDLMSSIARQYFELTKPRVVALIVFTAIIGMFLAVPGWPPLRQSLAGFIGIWLAAASAAAINHLIDQEK